MKFMNWGTKIVLGMISFMLFIVAMVIYMFHVHGRDALVEDNYYEKGIDYNTEYNAKQNVIHDGVKPKISITPKQFIIQLSDSAQYELILMRPSNSNDDLKLTGNTSGSSNLILIDKTRLAKGVWFLDLKWHSGVKDYLYKDNIRF
ncbi:FixH family protein [Pedobacter aquatilis]|uniref:FixH family protein n=1 Tax=Pedobacter aquatilis TaxID=351343 RepID=UPI00292EA2D1|nr:FixH family protein [Pedobacter aquatilis]